MAKISATILAISIIGISLSDGSRVCILRRQSLPKNAPNVKLDDTTDVGADCVVPAQHLDSDEMVALQTSCNQTTGDSSTLPLLILTVQDGIVNAEKSIHPMCRSGLKGSLTWVKFSDFNSTLRQLVNHIGEGSSYLGRNVLDGDDKYEVCKINLDTGDCSSVEQTVNSTQTGQVVSIEILLERLPVGYELRNVQYSRWKNVTDLDHIDLGSVMLTNTETVKKFIQAEIKYDFESDVTINLPERLTTGLPIEIFEDGRSISRFVVGKPFKTHIIQTYPVIKELLPKTSTKASLHGVWIKSETPLDATLITIYENNGPVSEYDIQQIKTSRVELTVSEIRTQFAISIKLDVIQEDGKQEDTDTQSNIIDNESEKDVIVLSPTKKPNAVPIFHTSGYLYPDFLLYFKLACAYLGLIVLIIYIDVIRKLIGDYKARKNMKEYEIVKQYY